MRNRLASGVLVLMLISLLACGCIKAARQGAANGVTTGVSNTIFASFDAIVAEVRVGE